MIEDLAGAVELDAMLAPLTVELPVGADLRTDFAPNSLYYRLRDARAEARAAERTADAASGADTALPVEWRSVRQLAIEALRDATKDLEIAAWLTEALIRGEGFAGLAIGARLMQGLVRGFWSSGLYPQEDEDGVATRVAPITGLNGEGADGTLIQPLRKQLFFRTTNGQDVAFFEYAASRQLQAEANPTRRQQRIAAGVLPFEEMERQAQAIGGGWFAVLRREIRAADAAWGALGDALDAVAGRDGPPTGRVKELLAEMLEAATRYAPEEEDMAPAPAGIEPVAAASQMENSAADATAPLAARKVESREDMLRELARIADFFRRTEPHSPLAYTLDDAVRRGRMSWPDLLAEIVPDTAARSQMLLQLGIKPSNI